MKFLWPRFGADGVGAGPFLAASPWPLGASAAYLVALWARNVAEGMDAEGAAQGLACLAVILSVPLALHSRSRFGLATLAAALSAGVLGMAVDASPAGWAGAAALSVYGVGLVRAGAARRGRERSTRLSEMASTEG